MYEPNYTITDDILNRIAEIESLRVRISSSYILPEREVEMRYRATVEATHSSTSIEGNPLTNKQVERVLSEKSDKALTRHQYAELEVQNYKSALDYIEKRKVTGKELSVNDILTVHKIITNGLLAKEKSGVFRDNQVIIENQAGELVYTAPDASTIICEVESLLDWMNGSANIHPIIKAAIFHIQLVSIHPFADGNGRMARALTMLYLGMSAYDFRSSIVLDSFYNYDKEQYYEKLHASQGDDYNSVLSLSLNPWLDYFVEGFLSSAKVLEATILILESAIGTRGEALRIKQEDADLLSYAKQFGSVSLSEAEDILAGLSSRSVQRRLKKLVDEGYLKRVGLARDTHYILNRE